MLSRWPAGILLLGALSAAQPPAWVERMPERPGHYIGIGRADKAAHPADYREAAQTAALAQISREISIRIKTESRSVQEEGSQGRSESFSQSIQGISANELAGYELVDQYETPESLWLYYALDKEEYGQALMEKEREREAWRKAVLRVEPALWAFKGREAKAATARVTVVKGSSRDAHLGPLSLMLSPRAFPGRNPCLIETGTAGEVDLEEVHFRCGLEPGPWKVLWSGPEGRKVTGEISIKVEKAEWCFTVRTKDMAGWKAARWEEELAEEMSARESPRIRWTSAAAGDPGAGKPRAGKPRMEIGLRQAMVDSLDGIHFTALRGWIRLPGVAAPREILGEAGHADPSVSRARAVRDFVREVALSTTK